MPAMIGKLGSKLRNHDKNVEKRDPNIVLTREADKDLAYLDQHHPDAWVVERTEYEGYQMKHPLDCNLHLVPQNCACPP